MKQKKLFQEFFRYMLQQPCSQFANVKQLKEKIGIDALDQLSVAGAIGLAMVDKAINGDVGAATWIRDTAGEKPTEERQGLLGCGEIRIFVQKNEQKIEITNKNNNLQEMPDNIHYRAICAPEDDKNSNNNS